MMESLQSPDIQSHNCGPSSILITGATGLLGAHVAALLVMKGVSVAGLRRSGSRMEVVREIFSYYSDDPDALMQRVEWRTGDLTDPKSLTGVLEGIVGVVNCAAVVSFEGSRREEIIRINEGIVRSLTEAISKQKDRGKSPFLVHISSTSALGDAPGDDPAFKIDEETPRNPMIRHNGYSESKHRSEQLIWRAIRDDGLQAVIFNPGIILGPGQWDRGSSLLIARAAHGMKFFPYGGTGYVDVRDVAKAVELIINSWLSGDNKNFAGHRYVLVGANLRYKELFIRVTDELGLPNPTIYAGRLLTGLAWRFEVLRALILRRPPALTRDAARSSRRIAFYSSEKISRELEFQFRPISETISWVCRAMQSRKPA